MRKAIKSKCQTLEQQGRREDSIHLDKTPDSQIVWWKTTQQLYKIRISQCTSNLVSRVQSVPSRVSSRPNTKTPRSSTLFQLPSPQTETIRVARVPVLIQTWGTKPRAQMKEEASTLRKWAVTIVTRTPRSSLRARATRRKVWLSQLYMSHSLTKWSKNGIFQKLQMDLSQAPITKTRSSISNWRWTRIPTTNYTTPLWSHRNPTDWQTASRSQRRMLLKRWRAKSPKTRETWQTISPTS